MDTYTQPITQQKELDLIAYTSEDLQLIGATAELPPMAAAALERIRQRLQQLGIRASARFVEEAR